MSVLRMSTSSLKRTARNESHVVMSECGACVPHAGSWRGVCRRASKGPGGGIM